MIEIVAFLQGVSAAGAWISGLVFLRFWRRNSDPLFAYFAAAFWLLGVSWTLLALSRPDAEARPYVYGIRLIAFGLIIGGVISKNRGGRTR
jgi:hypothetical protein